MTFYDNWEQRVSISKVNPSTYKFMKLKRIKVIGKPVLLE